MIACFDVQYQGSTAQAAAVLFRDWAETAVVDQFVTRVTDVGEYQAGSFYQRELRPLRAVLSAVSRSIDYFVIDAYCHLSADRDPGLGAYLHEVLPADSIVIGVAKNRFRQTSHAVELFRGTSRRPLFITSIGIDYQVAAGHIEGMVGEHRIPRLLKQVDRLCRGGLQ